MDRFKTPIFLICCLLTSLHCFAQNNAVILNSSTRISVEQGKQIYERTVFIQINDKASNWISDISIGHSDDVKLDILEASILDKNGNILRKLKKKEIETSSDISNGSFYEDNLMREFSLNWHQYPYQIRYSYRKVFKEFLNVAYWQPYSYFNIPVVKASLEVDIPIGYKTNQVYSEKLKYETKEQGNSILHSWSIYGLKPLKKEKYCPPMIELVPSVRIVPEEFSYGIEGKLSSWETYGTWQGRVNEDRDILPAVEKQKVDQLTQGLDDPKEIIKVLYYYLQDNTRYIFVSIDEGGLTPYPASYVSEKKYGDCKALTIFMKAMLRYKGLDSYYTKIYGDANPVRINKDLPAQQFNHVILSVPLESDTVWLENTSTTNPYNYLGTFTQNRYGLLVDGEKSQLIKTPALLQKDMLVTTRFDFELDAEGMGKVKVHKTSRGEDFEDEKYISQEFNLDDQMEYLREISRVSESNLLDWNFSQANRDSAVIDLELNYSVKNQFRKLGKTIAIKPIQLELIELEDPELRDYPLRITIPVYTIDSMVYHLPFLNQYSVKFPEDIVYESGYGKYELRYSFHGDQLIVHRTFKLNANDYSIVEYPDFYSFMEFIRNSTRKSIIVLNPK